MTLALTSQTLRGAMVFVAVAAVALSASAALAVVGPQPVLSPRTGMAKLDDLPTPLPMPYEAGLSQAQAASAVDRAFAEAGAQNKRVIVDLGGNWCGWCRILAGVMDLPTVKPFIDANFKVVSVDVSSAQGKTDKNLAVVRRFGMTKVGGFPWLIVAEPNGKVLTSSYEVTDKRHQTPQAMVDWLAKWAKRPSASLTFGGQARA